MFIYHFFFCKVMVNAVKKLQVAYQRRQLKHFFVITILSVCTVSYDASTLFTVFTKPQCITFSSKTHSYFIY